MRVAYSTLRPNYTHVLNSNFYKKSFSPNISTSLTLTMDCPSKMHDQDYFRDFYMNAILKNCKLDENSECLLWQKSRNKGYGHMSYTFTVKNDNNSLTTYKKFISSHRLMFAVTINFMKLLDKDMSKTEVSHLCHNKLCCNICHLEAESTSVNNSRTGCQNLDRCVDHDPACMINSP